MQNTFSFPSASSAQPDTIGDRLRRARVARNLTLHELSRLAGLSAGAISDIENGRQKSSTRLHRLADALGVSIIWLEAGAESLRGAEPSPIPQLADIYDIRRKNLRALIQREAGGKQVTFAARLGVPQNLVSRWLGRKRIGHNTARRCELAFGLAHGSMDRPIVECAPAPAALSDASETALSQLINNWFACDANGKQFIELAAKIARDSMSRTEAP